MASKTRLKKVSAADPGYEFGREARGYGGRLQEGLPQVSFPRLPLRGAASLPRVPPCGLVPAGGEGHAGIVHHPRHHDRVVPADPDARDRAGAKALGRGFTRPPARHGPRVGHDPPTVRDGEEAVMPALNVKSSGSRRPKWPTPLKRPGNLRFLGPCTWQAYWE